MLRKIWIVLGAVALFTTSAVADMFAAHNFPTATSSVFILSVAVVDVDEDGREDLIVGGGGGSIMVLLGNGDGTFADATHAAAGWTFTLGDIDGDSHQDLVIGDASPLLLGYPNTVTVLSGNGDGTFAEPTSYAFCLSPSLICFDEEPSVALGDFNGDGHQDVILASHVAEEDFCGEAQDPDTCYIPDDYVGGITLLLGYGDGTLADPTRFVEGNFYSVVVSNFNGDGNQDLAADGLVLLGNGDGTFAAPVNYPASSGTRSGAAGGRRVVADLNGDGNQDLVSTGSDYVWVQLGNGDGTFATSVSYPASLSARSVAVGDFDGNGWQDIVTANGFSNNVTVLLNQGIGTLTVGSDIKPDSYPNSINPYSRGVIPVAILGTDTFDVADIDVTTLAFGPGGAPIAHLNGHLQDVNYDGIMDLMLHFRTQDTGIACGNESATLTGQTLDGRSIEGTDSIQTPVCRTFGRAAAWLTPEDQLNPPRSGRIVDVEAD